MTLIRKHQSSVPSIWNDLFESNLFNHHVKGNARIAVPPVNISESDESYLVELAVPGLKKEDFDINLDKTVMTISAKKDEKETEEKTNYSKREFSYRSFRRSFTLPSTANLEGINASYDEGVLNVTIAKKDKEKQTTSRSISVK